MAALQLFYDVSKTTADPEFEFDDNVTCCAIASGNLDTVQWCIENTEGGSGDKSLLKAAIMYAQPRVADWLLAEHPECIAGVTDMRFEVYGDYAKTPDVFDWLNRLDSTYPHLKQFVQPTYIANYVIGSTPYEIVAA